MFALVVNGESGGMPTGPFSMRAWGDWMADIYTKPQSRQRATGPGDFDGWYKNCGAS